MHGRGGGLGRALTWGAACGSATAFLVCWIQYKTEDGKFDPLGLFKDGLQWISCAAKKTNYGVSILTLRQVRPHAKLCPGPYLLSVFLVLISLCPPAPLSLSCPPQSLSLLPPLSLSHTNTHTTL